MHQERRAKFIEYVVGVPIVCIIYLVVSMAFMRHMQFLVDSKRAEPWYYSILGFFVSFPFLYPSGFFVPQLRRFFDFLEPVFGSGDNGAMIAIVILDAIFWGFVAVFCFRLIRGLKARRSNAGST